MAGATGQNDTAIILPPSPGVETIIAFAPDPAGARAGQELAVVRKWQSLGSTEELIWGECQGSGKVPYQTCVLLTEEGFKCSCPSRKFPCKHGIGLLLLYADNLSEFTVAAPPKWVINWVSGRSERAKGKSQELIEAPRQDVRETPRSAQREARIAAGISELKIWLRDLARQGIAETQARAYGIWDNIAARMVDAQAPGAARIVRELSSISRTGDGWQLKLLFRLSQLHLLAEGFENRANLPKDTVSDILTTLGWPVEKSQIVASVSGDWAVVGQRVVEEDRLHAQRTWLYHIETRQPALILQYSHGQVQFDIKLSPGTTINAELEYYPSRAPLRAFFGTEASLPHPLIALPFAVSVADIILKYSETIAAQPWTERIPASICGVLVVSSQQHWYLQDQNDDVIPLDPRFNRLWHLLAITGGRPTDLFGEYDGDCFWPLSCGSSGKVISL